MGKKRELSIEEKVYYPEIFRGMYVTTRHLVRNFFGFLPLTRRFIKKEVQTYQWPEEERPISERWRGRHRLNKRDDGSVKCVACFCCATACPAGCITIEAGEHPDPAIEKYPVRFDINLFECMYCGMCVEACPCDAIYMDTMDMRLARYSPDKFVITKEELLEW
jgi:NADH-quinone oxidoreductase subunit I